MKAGWEIKTLGEVCNLITCGVAATPKYVDENEGIPFLSAQNVRDGEVVLDKYRHISKEFHQELTKKNKPAKGDILYSRVGSKFGEAGVVEHEFEFSVYVSVTLIKPTRKKLDSYFLKHYLNSPFVKSLALKSISSSGVPNLNVKDVREFPISLPPLPEQKRLVTLLDEAFESIATAKANAQQNLKNARALFESHLNEVFTKRGEGWEERTLGDVCDFSQGIQVDVKLQHEIKTADNQVRFLRIVDFTQGNEPARYINNSDDRFFVSTSDVSLVRYGASTGFVCSGLEGAIANNLFRVIPKKNYVSNGFLYWFLNAPIFQEKIKNRMNGAAMPAISFGMINNIQFPFPSSSEQQQLVSTFDIIYKETQRLESLYSRKVAALDELKKALLHRAFSGEL